MEDSGLPRLYRESPLNSIWEGSGNVIALDVVRAATREPASVAALLARAGDNGRRRPGARWGRSAADFGACRLGSRIRALINAGARQLSGLLARCLAGSLLVRLAPGLAGRFLAGLAEPSAALGARPVQERTSRSERFRKLSAGAASAGRSSAGAAMTFQVSVGRCLAGLVGIGDGSRSPLVRVVGLLVGRARPTDRDLPGLQIDALAA